MKVGLYCNWGVVYHSNKYYVPAVHKKYLDAISEKNGFVYLMCSVKESIPLNDYVSLDKIKVNVIRLPSFHSYISSIPHFFSIVKGFYVLMQLCDFIYIRTPEPFSWVASLFLKKAVILNYHYASNPIEVILQDNKTPAFIKFLKVTLFLPEFYLIAIAAYFNRASANGPSVLQNVPFFIRKKMRVLYESTISLSTLSQKIHRPILDNEKIRFLTVSRLHSGKGLHLLLDVFSLIKAKYSNIDFELTIVGDGPLGDALADYAKSLDLLDRVNFSGVVANGSDLDFVYASHDVFIMPSLSETGPRVLIEAMSESNFCIASNVGYVNVLLGEGAGLMVKPGCIDALSKSILWVYDNKKKAQDMALKGFTESKKYSIESFFNQLLKA